MHCCKETHPQIINEPLQHVWIQSIHYQEFTCKCLLPLYTGPASPKRVREVH